MNQPTPEEYKAAEEHQRRAVEETWQKTDLESLSDKALAQWQTKQRSGSREAILADQQWKIRLLNRQLKTSKRLAWLGCFSGLLGVVLGYCLHLLDRPTVPATGVIPKQPPNAHAEQKAF